MKREKQQSKNAERVLQKKAGKQRRSRSETTWKQGTETEGTKMFAKKNVFFYTVKLFFPYAAWRHTLSYWPKNLIEKVGTE